MCDGAAFFYGIVDGGTASVAGAGAGGVGVAGADCVSGTAVTCPAFSCACSALSLASLDFASECINDACALAALVFARAAASSRFCCWRCAFNSLLLIVPYGCDKPVVAAVGSAGLAVARGGVVGVDSCAIAPPVNIAQSASIANRIAIVEELFIYIPSLGESIPVAWDGLAARMGTQHPKVFIINQLQTT